ncbi:hypothetical protein Tco_0962149 [Tanacetum coccineum]
MLTFLRCRLLRGLSRFLKRLSSISSKKMSKRQLGTGSKPGVPDEEKLILEWEADVDSELFDRDDNAGDDNKETKPDPEEIYK